MIVAPVRVEVTKGTVPTLNTSLVKAVEGYGKFTNKTINIIDAQGNKNQRQISKVNGIYNRDNLKMFTPVVMKLSGNVVTKTMQEVIDEDLFKLHGGTDGKIRCQATFDDRGSASFNGILRLGTDGKPTLYDNGSGTTYVIGQTSAEMFKDVPGFTDSTAIKEIGINEFSTDEEIDILLKESSGFDPDKLESLIKDVHEATGKSDSYLKGKLEQIRIEKNSKEPIFDLGKFSLSGNSKEMKKNMLEEVHILKDIALLGQITAIYAKPNTGKTLLTIKLLIESIDEKIINPKDVYYINADDAYRGLTNKLQLAEKYGFEMLAPGHKEFKANELAEHMQIMADQDIAKGKIIILDTLKKFTDLMDKKSSSCFMNIARSFSSNGGSLILLAHTNKNRDSDGKVIAGGTSDIIDDADCAFTLDEMNHSNGEKTVLFENKKMRGNVNLESAYKYSTVKGSSYEDRLNSVQVLDSGQAEEIKQTHNTELELELEADQPIIKAIINALQVSNLNKTELVNRIKSNRDVSINRIKDILNKYINKKWYVKHEGKNTHIFTLSPPPLPAFK